MEPYSARYAPSPEDSPLVRKFSISEAVGSGEYTVSIAKTTSVRFLFDLAKVTGAEQVDQGLERLPEFFDWLSVPAEPALSLVKELVPDHSELVPDGPLGILVAPSWDATGHSVEVLVNAAHWPRYDLLVRVPSWAKFFLGEQLLDRWIALQPHLSRFEKVAFVGVDTSSSGERCLRVFLRAVAFDADDLKELASYAGAPAGTLLHFWRSFMSGSSEGGRALLSFGLTGSELIDVGVSFAAQRVGTASELQQRIFALARVHGLGLDRYLDAVDAVTREVGEPPEHSIVGFAAERGRMRIAVKFKAPIG